MTDAESQPLLEPSQQSRSNPSLVASARWLILNSRINLLTVFVPLGILAKVLNWGPLAIFLFNFIAIVPLAKLLGDATEQVSIRVGQTIGGLLNATFGNAVELIVAVAALFQGQLRIVQMSLVGSILSNLLLVLGCSFVAGGIYRSENTFAQTAAQASGSIMTLGCFTMVVPAAYFSSILDSNVPVSPDSAEAGLLFISRGTSLILLAIYAGYIVFQLRTHSYLYAVEEEEGEQEKMSPKAAVIALLVITIITSFNADYLVSAIDDVARDYHISKAFIGIILLPLVGNAAEHVTSIWMAAKNKMEIALGVAIGSSIQIAVGLVPMLVIVGWMIGQPLTLYFHTFETTTLFVTVLLVNTLIQDGKSNYLEGAMLVGLYIVIALSFWVRA
ncbi:hypothetical protein MCUN1_003472 [Malassezia cuniculi]|uniref:Vacuolar calcium ion transporter n=1 Tax=Malassezia cuniculi TaxID=948313 RepID=A0AAF0EY38_9BASI|nr:hypothetical protein MCUN1_003472 [Malassezia cuniculi]